MTFKISQDNTIKQCRNQFELLDCIQTKKSEHFKDYDQLPFISKDKKIRVTAFYLPQFHTIPENDKAWGKGFTEWTNVTRTQPFFPGHLQPYLPSDLGFYDLNNLGVINSQVELAKHYGVTGFCFHYYWFEGRKILQKPLENFVKSNNKNFEFSICWANESWSKRWNGSEQDIIVQQKHSYENDKNFIIDIFPYLENENYTRVNGRPLIILYRPLLMGESLEATVESWRNYLIKKNLGNPLILSAPFGLNSNQMHIHHKSLDGYVQFPPHEYWNYGVRANSEKFPFLINKKFEGLFYDGIAAKDYFNHMNYDGNLVFRCAFPSWDNSARKREKSSIFCNTTPNNFQKWMEANFEIVKNDARYDNLVFVNAWNEWAEGAVLEPSSWYGYAYLDALKSALIKYE